MGEEDYEKKWMKVSLGIVILILLVLGSTVVFFGFGLPSHQQSVDPTNLPTEFSQGMVKEVAPGKYEVYMEARQFNFNPRQIKVPEGSEVTFYVTATDVQHGFQIVGTNVNMQVLPGHVNSITHTFDEPGEYLYICNEYCGQGHHMMFGKLVVGR